MTVEANFDGLAGPTHNYVARSLGNILSEESHGKRSNPRLAALQGLAKMKLLADRGLVQGFVPPHERPYVEGLRRLGYSGSDAQVVENAGKEDRQLLSQFYSASAMWAANAATVTPSSDALDGRIHFTPANLIAKSHRFIEATTTARFLARIFPDERHFVHHPPLPAHADFGDEGAANHMRLAPSHGMPGLNVYVYGRTGLSPFAICPQVYPARQTLEASAALARSHRLSSPPLFLQQSPAAIDAGIFHNDVIAVSNENLLVVYEEAYVEPKGALDLLKGRAGEGLQVVEVTAAEMTLQQVVESYVLNSQIVTMPNGDMEILVPEDRLEGSSANLLLDRLLAETSIRRVHRCALGESVANGGGPACLRLRVVLNPEELAAVDPAFLLTDVRYEELVAWVERHYRDRLDPEDLADPSLLEDSQRALDDLTTLLKTGSLYRFQGQGDR